MTKTYLVFRLTAVLSVLLCGLLDKPWLAAGALFAMLTYAAVGWRLNRDHAEKLEAVGEQVYFVGYLSTISAFAGVILRIWFIGGKSGDPRPILLMMGVALMTTVLGLLAMTILKDHALALGGSASDADGRSAGLPRPDHLPSVLDTATMALNHTIELSSRRHLAEVIDRIAQSIDGLNAQIDLLKGNTETLSHSADLGAVASLQLTETVRQLQSVLDEYVRLLECRLEFASDYDIERV